MPPFTLLITSGQVTPENLAKGWEQVTKLPAPQSVPKQFGGTHEDRQLEQIMKIVKPSKSKL